MVKLLEKIQKKLTELKSPQEKLNYLYPLLDEIKDEDILKKIKEIITIIEDDQKQQIFLSTPTEKPEPVEEQPKQPQRLPQHPETDSLEDMIAMPQRETKTEAEKREEVFYELPTIQDRLQRYAREIETSQYARPGDVVNYALNKELKRRGLTTNALIASPELRNSFMHDMNEALSHIGIQNVTNYISQFDNNLKRIESEALINAEDTMKYRAKQFDSRAKYLKLKEEDGK